MAATETEKKNFQGMIENISKEKNLSILDSILWYCEHTDFEIAVAATLINSTLKSAIEKDGIILNLLKK